MRVDGGCEAARNHRRIGGRPHAISSEKLAAILEALDSEDVHLYSVQNLWVTLTTDLGASTIAVKPFPIDIGGVS